MQARVLRNVHHHICAEQGKRRRGTPAADELPARRAQAMQSGPGSCRHSAVPARQERQGALRAPLTAAVISLSSHLRAAYVNNYTLRMYACVGSHCHKCAGACLCKSCRLLFALGAWKAATTWAAARRLDAPSVLPGTRTTAIFSAPSAARPFASSAAASPGTPECAASSTRRNTAMRMRQTSCLPPLLRSRGCGSARSAGFGSKNETGVMPCTAAAT